METECMGDSSDVAVSVQSEPMECLDDGDELSTALQQLKLVASQNSFSIHNVLCDGDCMFSAISYQVQMNDVCSADSSELRQKVADQMQLCIIIFCASLYPLKMVALLQTQHSLPLRTNSLKVCPTLNWNLR